MIEHVQVEGKRLGKEAKKEDPHGRTLQLAKYLDASVLAPAPPQAHWSVGVKPWGMALNDKIGDCVIAAQKHTVQCWTSAAGREVDLTDNDVLHTYEAITGYNPANPSSDQGTNILDAMNYWRRVGIGGHKIGAFAEVNWQNQALVQDAIYYFIGGLELGVQLPISAQRMGTHWTMPSNTRGSNAPGSWGGHGIVGVDYDRYGVTVVSWGQLIKVDWRFFFTYFDEAYVALSQDFIKAATGKTYLGFDLATLQADLSQLGHVK